MYCENCGEKISAHATFCPNCGQAVGGEQGATEARTRTIKRTGTSAGNTTKTTRMPRPAASAHRSSNDTAYYAPAATKTMHSHTPVGLILGVAAVIAVLAALYVVGVMGKSSAEAPAQNTVAAQAVSTTETTEAPQATPSETATQQPVEEAPQTTEVDSSTHAGGPQDELDDDTFATWTDRACSFMYYYPVNHVLAGGEGEPSAMDIDAWASNCLYYVDEGSSFGQLLTNDPDSIAAPLGFYEVASYTADATATSADANGVVVSVTIRGTQMDWSMTTDVTENFLVQFNDNNLIVNVVGLD